MMARYRMMHTRRMTTTATCGARQVREPPCSGLALQGPLELAVVPARLSWGAEGEGGEDGHSEWRVGTTWMARGRRALLWALDATEPSLLPPPCALSNRTSGIANVLEGEGEGGGPVWKPLWLESRGGWAPVLDAPLSWKVSRGRLKAAPGLRPRETFPEPPPGTHRLLQPGPPSVAPCAVPCLEPGHTKAFWGLRGAARVSWGPEAASGSQPRGEKR